MKKAEKIHPEAIREKCLLSTLSLGPAKKIGSDSYWKYNTGNYNHIF
jgi:hypothetical protein